MAFGAAHARALAERLIAIPSHSGDRGGEAWLARTLADALPSGMERGEWASAEGRPVPWARLRGRGRGAVLLLGHFDTVGVSEYAALGGAEGARVAYDPAALATRFASRRAAFPADERLARDLAEERASPGTWLFGRGALDMKGGLAAGIAALHALAEREGGPPGDVLFVATPDEERESFGMAAAVRELAALREREGLELRGAVNLDFVAEPVAWAGVLGKALVSLHVRGVPTHAGSPFGGVDASLLAAGILSRIASSEALVDHWHGTHGVPPVALRLRDLKPGYDVQTALEAEIELNVLSYARPLEETLSRIRRIARAAMEEELSRMRALSERVGRPGEGGEWGEPRVLGWPELAALAGDGDSGGGAAASDARSATRERVRAAIARASLAGPLAVVSLLPPYYPPGAPRASTFLDAARGALAAEGLETRPFYPYISDASYLAWRGPDAATVAEAMPVWGREYALPADAMRALDLDVLNLGPWGRDAHALGERVHAPYAFGRLPGLIARVLDAALE